jgi:hypothetical protein
MLLRISLEESFEVRNLIDIYKDKVPPEFYASVSSAECPITKEPIGQPRSDQMVLVEVGRWPKKPFPLNGRDDKSA